MKKSRRSILSLLLASLMLLGVLASCDTSEQNTDPVGEITTEQTDEQDSEAVTGSEKEQDSEGSTEQGTEKDSESETTAPTRETEEDTTPRLEGSNSELIELADRLANGVQSYYSDPDRYVYVMENRQMNLHYNRNGDAPQQVIALTDKAGNAYIKDTMDVFIRMTDGNIYYASNSIVNASTNMYRMGYYYNENRISNQMFISDEGSVDSHEIDCVRLAETHGMKIKEKTKETITVEITDNTDPWFSFSKVGFSAEKYKYLQITMKANYGMGAGAQIFVVAGSHRGYTSEQSISFSVSADGQFHTYTIPLFTIPDYMGTVKGLRVDLSGNNGSTCEVSSVKAISLGDAFPEDLALNRSFLTYSDKLHQIIQVAANKTTTGIAEIGMVTEIPADTVTSLLVKDKSGLKETLEGVVWSSVEYLAFDIKGAGIFGYILPYDGKGGKLTVTLANDVYTVLQTMTPENGTIDPSLVDTNNENDFYMGHRIYTDDRHDFTAFLREAELERNPLTAENVIVDTRGFTGSSFVGYDSLYGFYKFSVPSGGGFNGPFFDYPNRHFGVKFALESSDDLGDRKVYLCVSTTDGSLECSAILDEKDMLLPIPLEVSKNFKGDGENNLFMLDDDTYGEVYLPMLIPAGECVEYTVLHLYQNWGIYPLKQISSIQYFSPYYHLSTGVTETNCVVPYGSSGLSLPDFRSMSAPYWKSQPQHNSCGTHSIVQYDGENDVRISNQIESVKIDSYGPTYADMTVNFLSDDGKLRIRYQHIEMPQTDENRTFFELEIDVLGDLTVMNFRDSFYFYNVKPNDPTGYYTQVGYLDEDNACRVVAANDASDKTLSYVLGDDHPYFSFFNMKNYTSKSAEGYSNVAMLINETDFVIGGEKSSVPLVLLNPNKNLRLSLDLGDVSLKKGDRLKLTGILLPWGSQESVYDSTEFAPDRNVRDVREDSLLNPITPTALENCQIVDSTFLPRIKSTNGKSATFTLSGGENNVAVRVYGFEMLTVPTIYEKVNGEWMEYKTASVNAPDKQGYGYDFDGYQVHYDGDGTFSYSFVIPMDEGKPRTFRIEVDKPFEGREEESNPAMENLPLNVYITPENAASVGAALTEFKTAEDGSFRFFGDGSAREVSVIPYKVSTLYETTGQYAVLKYRLPASSQNSASFFEFYSSTVNSSATGVGDLIRCNAAAIADGEWHVLVVDLSKLNTFSLYRDGTYLAQYLRVDLLDGGSQAVPATDYIDVAYFGMSDSLEDICKLNADMSTLSFYRNGTLKSLNVTTGEIVGGENVESATLPEETDLFHVYLPAQKLGQMTKGVSGCAYELLSNGSFVRYYGKGGNEAYLTLYSNSAANQVTGQYVVMKYRIPKDIQQSIHQLEVFAGTESAEPTGDGDRVQTGGYIQDGEWHLMVIDVSAFKNFKEKNGSYSATYLRIDVLNQRIYSTGYVDVAYVGMTDSIEKICAFNADLEKATFVYGEQYKTVSLDDPSGWSFESSGEEETESEKEPAKAPIVEDATSPAPADKSAATVFITPAELGNVSNSGCTVEVSPNGQFIRYYGKGSAESISQVYRNSAGDLVTGQYVILKYRISTDNAASLANIEVFAGTKANAPTGSGDQKQYGGLVKDGQWHVIVYDVATFTAFEADANGDYRAKYLRVDFLNTRCDVDTCIDIAFVAMADSMEDVLKMNADLESVKVMTGDGSETVPTK